LIIDDYPAYARAIDAFIEVGVTSVAGVPIISGERVFGAMCVLSIGKAKSFLDRDVAILTGIGRQAGIAVENAYLYENLRFYARRITQAQENERKRIARELHDDTIQSLIALSRRLEALATLEEQMPEAALRHVKDLWEQTDGTIKRVRRFSKNLRPSILDDLGLLPTLEELTADLNRQAGLRAEFRVLGEKRRLSSETELTLFRIAQEALSNVERHAEASVVITTVEIADSAVRVTVQDDGQGFKPPKLTDDLTTEEGLGLIGMHERVRLLGGRLAIESEPGRGTRVIANVPI
jgi:signal transduction histidine kinase